MRVRKIVTRVRGQLLFTTCLICEKGDSERVYQENHESEKDGDQSTWKVAFHNLSHM